MAETNYNAAYIDELALAIARTRSEKYDLPQDDISNIGKFPNYYSNEMFQRIMDPFCAEFSKPNGNFDLSFIKGRCIHVHHKMRQALKSLYGINCLVTVGYVTTYGKDMFKIDSIKSPTKGLTLEGIYTDNLHVWLTMPSYEILDYVFIAHFEYVNTTVDKRKLLQDAPSYVANFGDAESVHKEEHMIYHPMYVGEDVLIKNGYLGQNYQLFQ